MVERIETLLNKFNWRSDARAPNKSKFVTLHTNTFILHVNNINTNCLELMRNLINVAVVRV